MGGEAIFRNVVRSNWTGVVNIDILAIARDVDEEMKNPRGLDERPFSMQKRIAELLGWD